MEPDVWIEHIDNNAGEPFIKIRRDVFLFILRVGNFSSIDFEHAEKVDQPTISSISFKRGGGAADKNQLRFHLKTKGVQIFHDGISITTKDTN